MNFPFLIEKKPKTETFCGCESDQEEKSLGFPFAAPFLLTGQLLFTKKKEQEKGKGDGDVVRLLGSRSTKWNLSGILSILYLT